MRTAGEAEDSTALEATGSPMGKEETKAWARAMLLLVKLRLQPVLAGGWNEPWPLA